MRESKNLKMAMFNISNSNKIIDKGVFGGKAYWLSWLIQNGYKVPECFFISAIDKNDVEKSVEQLKIDAVFNAELKKFETTKNQFDIAVRSSALGEDSSEKSFAGHFKSFVETMPYEQILTNITDVIKSTDNQKMGVVIQKKINSKFAGVIFSSNPISASKQEILISTVEGMGDQLVSGKIAGEDIFVTCNSVNEFEFADYQTKIDKQILLQLCAIAKKIETTLELPIDIEWCVNNSNELFILQCRPITTIFPKQTGIIPINISNENLIPPQLNENDKVKIRLIAQHNNIDISNAYLVINTKTSIIDINALSKIKPQERCNGYSLVLIFPKRISGKIIRHFAKKEENKQNSSYRICQRYGIRSYQDYSNLSDILQSIQSKCCESSWLCVTIIQEIFEPSFTGIVKKIDAGCLIEIAKGHFIPKGIVPTSQYILNNRNEITFKNEIVQKFSYKISQGTVTKENINTFISIKKETLINIVSQLMPLLSKGIQAVEFGLLEDGNTNKLNAYLIDLVDDSSSNELSSKLISEGVISTGIRNGKVKYIDIKTLGQNSLELHFYNQIENKNNIDEDVIFIAETPDIALLEILKLYNNDKIGFVFKEGSALSHFSIILREKKIPAIVYKEKISLKDNDMINIDASSENIKSYERLSSGKSCVTSYVNPDLDGIVSSIVYAYYKTSKGNYNIPVYFGKLDNETIFALNHFKVAFPQKVLLVDEFETVTIVDTHNLVQLSQNFPTDKVVEILDHHTDGNLADFPNATINNEKIGAVCTMIAEYFKNEKTLIPEHIAGLLALGIVSNTLNFTAPSTTQRDKDAFSWLKLFVCITDDLIKQLFESRSSIDNLESSVIIANNMKEFVWGSAKIGISQVEMIDVNKLIDRSDFENSLLQIKENKNLDCIIFSGVDIFSHKTHIVVLDNETLDIVNKGMGYNFSSSRMIVDKILLRKTDFIPNLKNYFENQ